MHIFWISILIYDAFYMFRIQTFFFRKKNRLPEDEFSGSKYVEYIIIYNIYLEKVHFYKVMPF
jgi:hypothetical protein